MSILNEPGNAEGARETAANGAEAMRQASAAPSAPDAALAKKLGDMRQHLQASFAKVAVSMMTTPRYKHCSLSELEQLALDPLMRGRVAIAQAKPAPGAAASHDDALAGIAIWAKVSAQVDAKIREQIKAGVFPIRLKAGDWDSGEIAWLLDVIAPNATLATAVLANFRQTVKEGQMFAHPIVRSLLDPALLKATAAEAPKANATSGG